MSRYPASPEQLASPSRRASAVGTTGGGGTSSTVRSIFSCNLVRFLSFCAVVSFAANHHISRLASQHTNQERLLRLHTEMLYQHHQPNKPQGVRYLKEQRSTSANKNTIKKGKQGKVVKTVIQDGGDNKKAANSTVGYYRSVEELQGRDQRFPSVEDRLKVYLSTWYIPPCPENQEGLVQYSYPSPQDDNPVAASLLIQTAPRNDQDIRHIVALNSTIDHSRFLFVLDEKEMKECKDKYCIDTIDYVLPALDRISDSGSSRGDNIPTILQFGDAEEYTAYLADGSGQKHNYPMFPVIKKFRYSMDASELERVTTTQQPSQCYDSGQPRALATTVRSPTNTSSNQAIVSIVSDYERHFGPIPQVPQQDTAWDQKRPAAIWRGALTGRNRAAGAKKLLDNNDEVEWCRRVPRCNLVLQHGNSTTVDAKLRTTVRKFLVSQKMEEVEMFGESLSMADMLKYKAIIMIEGNDISSGLKWALFSNSVVMMNPPTCTSWAMEELLQPWVHYIPLKEDFSDVEDQVQWMIEHDGEAQEIAHRGRLWITDLIYHPEAASDNEQVLDETFRRYKAHFAPRASDNLMRATIMMQPASFATTTT